MEEVDCIVVGAGVVGLAVARALALSGREVIVLEAAREWIKVLSGQKQAQVKEAPFVPTRFATEERA